MDDYSNLKKEPKQGEEKSLLADDRQKHTATGIELLREIKKIGNLI